MQPRTMDSEQRQQELVGVIIDYGGVEVDAMEVYGTLFRLGEGFIQQEGESPDGSFKANPIILGEKNGRIHRRILFEDTFEQTIKEFQDYDWAVTNGLTYFGRANRADRQSKMCAMIFDIDGVTYATLTNLFYAAVNGNVYPLPNYVVLSGHGVHLYYVFEEPVALYPDIKRQLKDLKYALTRKIWNRHTSVEKKVQYQGINQGFRIVGGKTKVEGRRTRAFLVNRHPFNPEDFNEYVPSDWEGHIDLEQRFKPGKCSLAEAKKRWPEWYESCVIGGLKGTWTVKRDLYDWWKKKVLEGATGGHRYFCIMALAIFARKCGIGREELERDAYGLVPYLNRVEHIDPDTHENEPFTEADVRSALECYDPAYVTFPRKDIEKITAIPMPANKRNGRTQAVHLQIARAVRDIDYPDGSWRDGAGRPKGSGEKKQAVLDWRKANPEGRKADCIRDTGLSKPTVYKWWDWQPEAMLPKPLDVVETEIIETPTDPDGGVFYRLVQL